MAKEYIERQAAIDAVAKDMGPHRTHDFNAGCARAVNRIIDVPAADVVKVVRCGECKHLCVHSEALGVYQCAVHGDYPSGEYFCADGERKDGGNEDD